MAKQKPSGPVTVVERNESGTVGVFHYDPETETEAVLLYDFDISSAPLEQRLWRAQWPMTAKQRSEILDSFEMEPKSGITDEVRRSAPWSVMQASARAYRGEGMIREAMEFEPPSQDLVNELLEAGVLPAGIRNSRDMAAHAAELRAAKCYLLSVYVDHSLSPMTDVAAAEDVTITRARNLIDRARQHHYLTRTEGLGGELTEAAHAVAAAFDAAIKQISQ